MYKILFVSFVLFFMHGQAQAFSITSLEGFITKFDDQIYPSTNYYFTMENETFRIENYSGIQSFKVIGKDLFIEISNNKPVRIGEINLELDGLKNNERTRMNILEDVEVESVFLKKKSPKVERYLSCGITGCSIGKKITERTERIISLKVRNGSEFCFYQNIKDRLNGVLYPEKCIIK